MELCFKKHVEIIIRYADRISSYDHRDAPARERVLNLSYKYVRTITVVQHGRTKFSTYCRVHWHGRHCLDGRMRRYTDPGYARIQNPRGILHAVSEYENWIKNTGLRIARILKCVLR
eukprot:SAG31_NODE_82_length_27046_cov_45.857275_2_plen_117_part_00